MSSPLPKRNPYSPPISNLPPELLVLVFLHGLSSSYCPLEAHDAIEQPAEDARDDQHFVSSVTAVSSLWRSLGVSTPLLWTRIIWRHAPVEESRLPVYLDQLSAYIERSTFHDLDVYLDFTCSFFRTNSRVWTTLSPHVGRFRSLRLIHQSPDIYFPLKGNVSRLKALDIHHQGSPHVLPLFTELAEARLETLRVHTFPTPSPFSPSNVGAGHLKRLLLCPGDVASVRVAVDFMRECVALEVLHLRLPTGDIPIPDGLLPARLPTLHTLTLTDVTPNNLWLIIDTPNLRTLNFQSLGAPKALGRWRYEENTRSFSSLRYLNIIGDGDRCPPDLQVLAILRSAPKLVQITCTRWKQVGRFLWILIGSDVDGRTDVLDSLSSLRTIRVEHCRLNYEADKFPLGDSVMRILARVPELVVEVGDESFVEYEGRVERFLEEKVGWKQGSKGYDRLHIFRDTSSTVGKTARQ